MAGIETDEAGRRIYEPDGAVLAAYLEDRAHVSVIRGPIGSGSSTASCMKIYMTAMEMPPWASDGIRRSRWAVVRNTYPELTLSTLKTWLYWFPEEPYGRLIRSRPMVQTIRVGNLELEVWFLALDGPEDVQKLRSVEFTGIFFNELEFSQYEIFKEARSRTSRYPPKVEVERFWYGVIGDMNAPPEDHWVPRMTGESSYPEETPEADLVYWPTETALRCEPCLSFDRSRWSYFVQPPALIEEFASDGSGAVIGYRVNPKAENLRWLADGYYEGLARGSDKAFIDSRLMNRIRFIIDGEPVWKNFREEVHCSKVDLVPVKGHPVIVSLDFGRARPAALFAQEIGNRVFCQRELRGYNESSTVFAPKVKRFLEQNYAGFHVKFTGDPKGQDKGQQDERTAYDVFRSLGMPVTPAPVKNNHLQTRLSAVDSIMTTMERGFPRLLISPRCTTLRAACAGRYRIKKDADGEPEPIKDKWSDIADCLQYLCLYLGEGRRMIGLDVAQKAGAVRVSGAARSLRRVS